MPQLIDEPALVQWLDEVGIEAHRPLSVRRITSGHSNEVFELRRGGLRLALRRPPRAANAATAHDVGREFRVIRALYDESSRVPVPAPYAFCDDPAVIGAPFFVMEFVDGEVIRNHRVPTALARDPGAPRHMSEALLDTLVEIHNFDWQQGGLGDLGRPAGFLERQAKRWSGQLERYRTRPLEDLEEVGTWLATHIPAPHPPTLIHWDYRLDNVVYAKQLPIQVVAVLDWEVATIGDPLIDLGWLLAFWRDPGEDWQVDEALMGQFPVGLDFSTRAELAERYAQRTGRDISALSYFTVMALFKMACLLEGFYAKYLKQQSDDAPFAARMETFVPELAARAKGMIP